MKDISIEEVKDLLASGSFDLQPTQKRLCLPIFQRIHHKMKVGVEFNSINVADGLLIEGHHRYVCSLLLKKPINRNYWNKPSHIVMYQWSEVEVDENDWESTEMIERHNVKDAARSGLDVKTLRL